MKKNQGWKGEKQRHSMAKKGIHTNTCLYSNGKPYLKNETPKAKTISKSEYIKLRTKYDLYHKMRKELFPKNNALNPEMQEQLPPSPTTKEIGKIELYEWVHYPPNKYFIYINEKDRKATTWNGEKLGDIGLSYPYKDNFGGTRINISVYGNNGVVYYGTYYKSAGFYAIIKAHKGQEHLLKELN